MKRLAPGLLIALSLAAQGSAPNPRDLKFPPLRTVELPKVETFRLPNGMQLYLMEDHQLPIVAGTALIHTSTLFDPSDQIGLAALTGVTMRMGGTPGKSGEELDAQLDNLGASVDSGINENSGFVSFYVLKENLEAVLDVFRDVLTAPQFRQEKLDLAKTVMGGAIVRRNDDAVAIARREFKGVVYGKDSPYGWNPDYTSLGRIGQSEVRGFYARYYFPANVILAVRGDFSAADLKPRLEALFSGWREAQPLPPEFPKVVARPGSVYLAEKKGLTHSYFSIGQMGGEVKDADAAALQVMAQILGGGPQSRLQQRVGTASGITQVSARWASEMTHPGLFEVVGAAKPEFTLDAVKAVLEEVDRLIKTEITDEELKSAKESARNSLVSSMDTRAKVIYRQLTYEYFGYPVNFSDSFQKALAAVTKADVQKAARERIDLSQLTIVVVANTVGFVEDLKALGRKVNVIDLSVVQPKVEVSRSDEDTLARGKQILRRAQQAVGGADKLAVIRDFTVTQQFRLERPGTGGAQLTETDRWVAPNFFRQDSQMGQGRVVVYYDGQSGRVTTSQGTFSANTVQMKQVRGDLFRLYIRLLLSDRLEGRTVSATDENTVEVRDGAGEIARLAIDRDTGMPISVSYDIQSASGPPIAVLELFGGFREVGGIRIPERTTIFQRGQKFADVSVVDAQINKGTKPEELQNTK